MTTSAIAQHFGARKTKPGEYRAHCIGPLHHRGNRRAALSISEGKEYGKTVIYCHVGCDMNEVIRRAGLKWSDFNSNSDRSNFDRSAYLRARREQEQRDREQKQRERLEANIERLGPQVVADALLERLVRDPEAPGADQLAKVYHAMLDRSRQ